MKLTVVLVFVTAIAVTNSAPSRNYDEGSIQPTVNNLFKIIKLVCQDKELDNEFIRKIVNDPIAYRKLISEITDQSTVEIEMLFCPNISLVTTNHKMIRSNVEPTIMIDGAIQSTTLQPRIHDIENSKKTADNLQTTTILEESTVHSSQKNSQECNYGCCILQWLVNLKHWILNKVKHVLRFMGMV